MWCVGKRRRGIGDGRVLDERGVWVGQVGWELKKVENGRK